MRKRNLFKTILMFSAIVFGGTLISCGTNNDDTEDFDVSNVEQTDQVDDNTSNPTESEDPIGQDNQDNSDATDLVETATLIGIEVTTLPLTTYFVGDSFDATGMVVTATYSDHTMKEVIGYTISTPDMTRAGSQSLTVTYTEDTISVTTTFQITIIEVTLVSIMVTTEPTKTDYYVGETFDATGMEVTAMYSDDAEKKVTGYTISTPDMTRVGLQSLTVTYTEGKITVTTTFYITIIEEQSMNATLVGIHVTTLPHMLIYEIGGSFDSTGMFVTATYLNNTTAQVTDFKINYYEIDMTTEGTKNVVVTYTEGEVTVSTTFNIIVVGERSMNATLVGIHVTTLPTKFIYEIGENFNATGMVVTAVYLNNTTAQVTGYTVEAPDTTKVGTNDGSVIYSEGDITVNTTFNITVIEPQYF